MPKDSRDIDALVHSNFFAQLADQLTLTTIPLIAVLYLGFGAGQVGLLNIFQTLPYLILSIPLGVLVDRTSKKGVILGAETLRIIALLAIFSLVYFNLVSFWGLAVLGTIAAIGSVGFNAALPAYLPLLVEKSRLAYYNGRLEVMRSIALAAGPALAGALAGYYGATNIFISGMILSCLTMALMFRIRNNGKVIAPPKHPLRDIADGASFASKSKSLSAIMLVSLFWNCGWFVLQSAFMPLAIKGWGISPETVGYILGFMGAGLFLGSLCSRRIIAFLGFGPALAFGPILSFAAMALILVNTAWHSTILPAFAFFLFGFGPVIWVVTSNTLRQLIVPAHMLGCVSAIVMTMGWGARPLGGLIGAIIGTYYGEVACIIAATILFFIQMMLVLTGGLIHTRLETAQSA